jgi:hypothetical protein
VTPAASGWASPVLTTSDRAAAQAYRRGVAALVAGSPDAEEHLTRALGIDADLYLARVAVSVARHLDGDPPQRLPRPPRGVSRGERQHAEVVAAVLDGHVARADDLRREHLIEYPGDLLVDWIVRRGRDR